MAAARPRIPTASHNLPIARRPKMPGWPRLGAEPKPRLISIRSRVSPSFVSVEDPGRWCEHAVWIVRCAWQRQTVPTDGRNAGATCRASSSRCRAENQWGRRAHRALAHAARSGARRRRAEPAGRGLPPPPSAGHRKGKRRGPAGSGVSGAPQFLVMSGYVSRCPSRKSRESSSTNAAVTRSDASSAGRNRSIHGWCACQAPPPSPPLPWPPAGLHTQERYSGRLHRAGNEGQTGQQRRRRRMDRCLSAIGTS